MTAKDALEGIDEILDWFALHISTFGRLGKTDSETKQALYQQIIEIVGEDESLKSQTEYDKKHFGHPEADAQPNLQYVRQATRNGLRAELRQKLKEYFGVEL